MAGKKMKKAAKKETCCCSGGNDNLEEWLLVILGGLGFAQALGYLNLTPYYFAYVWSALVLVIGVKKIIDKSNCSC